MSATVTAQRWFLWGAIASTGLGLLVTFWPSGAFRSDAGTSTAAATLELDDIPFAGEAAYAWMQKICGLGSRTSGTAGMEAQQKMLGDHFRQLGGQVDFQEFAIRHPQTGQRVDMRNLWVTWHPERNSRILLCAHYDTRPFPDRDPDPAQRRRGVFVGANDGASGVAVLCVLAEAMRALPGKWGVDFVLFDGEELVYDEQRDPYFIGSTYFAQQWAATPQTFQYRAAVLLDMVGDKHLELFQETNSMRWPESRPWVQSIWRTAKKLNVTEFVARRKHEIRDDHLPLYEIAKIPALDIIDFDYPRVGGRLNYWHTTKDIPENCSPLSLAKVGWVLQVWLQELAKIEHDQQLP